MEKSLFSNIVDLEKAHDDIGLKRVFNSLHWESYEM